MDTTQTWTTVRFMLLIQGAIFVTSTIESLFALSMGPLGAITVALTAGLAAWTLRLATRAGGGHGRRSIRLTQWALLGWAGVDTALAMAMAGRLLEPVPLLTRVVLPIVILRLSRTRSPAPPILPKEYAT